MLQQTTKSRGILLFEESIKSEYTKIGYVWQLRQFLKFSHMESALQIEQTSSEKLQDLLEDYLIELKHTINPNSIPTRFTGLKHFCIMNRKNINWEIIYKMFPEKKKHTGDKPWKNPDIWQMLNSTNKIRTQSLIHFLASTGARIGVFSHNLKFKHIKNMQYGCMAVKLYAGDKDEYWSFLTPQATKAFVEYCRYRLERGECITKESPLFSTNDLKKQITWRSVRNITSRLIKETDIVRNSQGNRFDIQVNHGFRKRFNTILKLNNSINYNIAEKLLGHKNGLDGVYFVPTLDELFAEFQKAINDLEI